MPKVSVIIPNYNHAPYLQERINSVLNQTYIDFEVIILDDCSTDNSREIIEGYRGHKNVSRVIYNTINSGSTFKQWAKGIHLAKGEWIWIAESDDVAKNDFLEKAMLFASGDISLVFSNLDIIDENGKITLHDFYSSFHFKKKGGNLFIKEYFKGVNPIVNASSVIFSKQKFLGSGWSPIHNKLSGDFILWLGIVHESHIYFINEALCSYRKHNNSVTAKRTRYISNINEGLKNYLFIKNKFSPDILAVVLDGWIYQLIKLMGSENIIKRTFFFLYSVAIFTYVGKLPYFIKSCLKRK